MGHMKSGKASDEQHQEFSLHRGKAEIRQHAEVQFLNELISEFVHGLAIKVLESISEGTWYFRRKQSTEVTGFLRE
jgi:hypothetical protein